MVLHTQLASEYKRQYDPKANGDKMNIIIDDGCHTIWMEFKYIYKGVVYNFRAMYFNSNQTGDYEVFLYLMGNTQRPVNVDTPVKFAECRRVREMNINNMYVAAQYLIDRLGGNNE